MAELEAIQESGIKHRDKIGGGRACAEQKQRARHFCYAGQLGDLRLVGARQLSFESGGQP
jgi:hypothetical protein